MVVEWQPQDASAAFGQWELHTKVELGPGIIRDTLTGVGSYWRSLSFSM